MPKIFSDKPVTDGSINGAVLESGNANWQLLVGTITKALNQDNVRTFQATATPSIAVFDSSTPDVDITCDLAWDGLESVYLRVVDANNYIAVVPRSRLYRVLHYSGEYYLNHTQYYLTLDLVSNGSRTELASVNTDMDFDKRTQHEELTIRVRAYKDLIQVWQNGALEFERSVSTFTSATKHGIGKSPTYDPSEYSPRESWTLNYSATSLAPQIPTISSPTEFSFVGTNTPSAQIVTDSNGTEQKFEVQYATDTGFTQNFRTVVEPDTSYRTSGTASIPLPVDQALSQQTWFVRARSRNRAGDVSPWTNPVQFTVRHIPTATNLTPTAGQAVRYDQAVRHNWTFSDSYVNDTQTAYRVVVERNDDSSQVLDTGKILSGVKFRDVNYSASLLNVELRWRMKVWDAEDVESNWSSYQLFTPSQVSVGAITYPVDSSEVTTSAPEITWTFTPGVSGRTQKSYRIVVLNTGTNQTVLDTGVVLSSTARSYKPPYNILKDDNAYSVTLYVVDSANLSSPNSVKSFTVSYSTPAPGLVFVDGTQFSELGYIEVSWDSASDESFLKWRIYRRVEGGEFEVVHESEDPMISTFRDWFAPAQSTYEYSVVQVVERYGEEIETELTVPVAGYASHGSYWLLDELTPENSVRLYNVSGESFKPNKERAEFIVVGKGRHVEVGENIGRSGTLTAKFRDDEVTTARQKRILLESMLSNLGPVYLRNPFGDIYRVSLADPDYTRVVSGPDEFIDLSINYSEVF